MKQEPIKNQTESQSIDYNPHSQEHLVNVPYRILEDLIEVACDYVNPAGENHHGLKPISVNVALKAIRAAGSILGIDDKK